jgi:hypothetical protein
VDGWDEDPFLSNTSPLPPPDPAARLAAETFQETYRMYSVVVDRLVDIYRVFDKTRRAKLKEKLEDVYEALKAVGARAGVSSFALPHLSDC